MFGPFKKERPLLGLTGMGGGGTGLTQKAGGSFEASGGNAEHEFSGYKMHVFTGPGNFVVDSGEATVNYLVVAGGGGCAEYGGGGAGGWRQNTHDVSPGTYAVTVGGGGGKDSNGSPSSIPGFPAFATGGGAGGDGYRFGPNGPFPTPAPGQPGGSGGGGGYHPGEPKGDTVASPDSVSPTAQGNNGGDGKASSGQCAVGGGGGGAGQAGGQGASGCGGGGGGNGLQAPTAFRDPTNPYGTPGPSAGDYWFAGGGAGSGPNNTGGAGGGGGPWGTNGTANTGGGSAAGGSGGSGIVLISYET